MRNIVFGDTGGWLTQLLNSFDELGINAKESTMPKNMRVIHMGDLIHKGPHSSQLLAIVTGLMVRNPGQWVQLMGNHEAQHVPGAPRFWQCDCSSQDMGLLNLWRDEHLMMPTWGLVDPTLFKVHDHALPSTSLLFAHGGLTEGFWRRHARGERDPHEVATKINALPIDIVTRAGVMLGEATPSGQVGPVWAMGNNEVFKSWRSQKTSMPFTQLHGHVSSYSYDQQRWWPDLEQFRTKTVLLPRQRGVLTELNNNLMLGLDPGFSQRAPSIEAQPWFEFETVK